MESSPSVTVKDLDTLIEQLVKKIEEINVQSEVTTKLNKEYNALEYKIASYLKDLGREEYDHPAGKFVFVETFRVNMPESDLDKQAFFDHLRERGIFDKYATVNSNSLNALYKADLADAKTRGEEMTFTMPGIPAPKYSTKPDFKLKKPKTKKGAI